MFPTALEKIEQKIPNDISKTPRHHISRRGGRPELLGRNWGLGVRCELGFRPTGTTRENFSYWTNLVIVSRLLLRRIIPKGMVPHARRNTVSAAADFARLNIDLG